MKWNIKLFLKDVYFARNILRQLTAQQLILRYRRTVLGYFWTLFNPLFMMSIMALVFSTLFKLDLKDFAVFLFTGMIPWNFFNSVVSQLGMAFINNEGLIKKIYIPKIIFPLSITIALLIDAVFSFFALLLIIIFLGSPLSWAIFFIPIAFLLLLVFTLGIGLIVSIATVYFRDLQYVILIIMQGLFFLTPILFKPEALAGKVAWLINLNPLVPFIDLFRAPLYLGSLPSQSTIFLAVLFSFSSLLIGLVIFVSQEKKIVFRL
jgi:ABC-2 type transport system permease protein/lipopolysaccharide transport system permease protein